MIRCKYSADFQHVDGTAMLTAEFIDFPFEKGDIVVIRNEEFLVTERRVDPLNQKVKIILKETEN